MKPWHLFVASGLLVAAHAAWAKPTRTLVMDDTKVEEIRTAIGISTMLEFGVRPGGAIAGDQDAFKIEYAAGGLTIKPVLPGAKSNLFVFTDYDRYSFRLVTVPQAQADYRVLIKKKRDQSFAVESGKALRIKSLGAKKRCREFTLTVKRAAIPISEKMVIVDFALQTLGKPVTIQPGDFEFLSGDRTLTVSDLILSSLTLDPKAGVLGSAVIQKSEANPGQGIILGFASDSIPPKLRGCLRVSFSPWGRP